MPLIAAASAVAPPPPRRVAPLRSLCTRRPGILALTATSCSPSPPPPVVAAEAPAPPQEAKPKPRRYPKQYPGESVGVAEEMRFVAMRLRNPKRTTIKDKAGTADADAGAGASENEDEEDDGGGGMKEEHEKEEEGELEAGEWMPSMEGFVRYLVDSKLVFGTIERVVAESTDVACESQFSSRFFALTMSAILVNCRGL